MKGLPKATRSARPSSMASFGARLVEAVIGDDDPAEAALDLFIVEGRNGRAAGVALDHMEIGEAFA